MTEDLLRVGPVPREAQRRMTDEGPRDLEKLIERTAKGIRFTPPRQDLQSSTELQILFGTFAFTGFLVWLSFVATLAILVAAVGAFVGAAVTLGVGTVAGVVLAVLVGWIAWTSARQDVVVEPGVAGRAGLLGFPRRRVRTVTVRGEVGRPIEILADDLVLLSTLPDEKWTYPALVRLSHEIADIVGADLHDALTHPEWRSYHLDPAYRSAVWLSRAYEDSLAEAGGWHRVAPAEPDDLEVDLDGVTCPRFTMREGRLADHRYTAQLADIRAVAPLFWKVRNMEGAERTLGAIGVLAANTVLWVAARDVRDPMDAAILRGEADLVREYASRARPSDRGGVEDVPPELAAMLTSS
ncbi:MAG: hypothetical protein KC656_08265 [Myxococcales bacterium]|nr:hypothetical protein [Myxococcales bacterium]